jgi:hypothetical protein
MRKPNIRRSTVTVATVIALAVTAGSLAGGASAGKFATSSTGCSWPSLSLPFVWPWLDFNPYFLAPGGNFEGSLSGWTLSGGAKIVSGNESYYVGSKSDSHSLALPTTSSSVTTPTMCVTALSPTFRLFILNNGANGHTDGQLAFYLNFTGADGKPQQVKIAGLKGGTSWSLSPPISFIQYITGPLKNGTAQVSFTIKPNDSHGNWQIDDFYVDPLKSV